MRGTKIVDGWVMCDPCDYPDCVECIPGMLYGAAERKGSARVMRIKIHFQGGKYGDPICGTPGAGAATTARIEDVTCERCRKKLKKGKPALSWGANDDR